MSTNLVPFQSWPDVLAYAQSGQPLYYSAPMDRYPARLMPGGNAPFTYKAQARTIKIWPAGSVGRGRNRTSDPFTADAGHLDRFSRPAEGGMSEAARHREPVDEHAANELVMYIENTSDLSPDGPSGQGRSVLLNALRKWRKGTYDPELAVRLFGYLADAGAKRYQKEFGSDSPIFSPATRHEAAKQLEASFRSSAENGEYDHVDTRIGRETREAPRGQRMDSFTRAYFETALWSSTDESNGKPLDANYNIGDFAPETRDKMIADCADFQERFSQLFESIDSERAGHNFWLSRNGHGAGFFDDNMDEAQEAAESYGNFDLYVGDDGMIHGSGGGGGIAESSRRGHAKKYYIVEQVQNGLWVQIGHFQSKAIAERFRSSAPGQTRIVYSFPSGHDHPAKMHEGTVADFNSLDDLIAHAGREGATHVLRIDDEIHLYFKRSDGRYEKAEVWQKDGYWHTQAPGSRAIVRRPPEGAKPISGRSRHAFETEPRVARAPRSAHHHLPRRIR